MKTHSFPQYSPAWWKIREKKLTASNAVAIGNCGAGLKSLVHKIMQEYYSKAERISFSNHHTDRGNDLEDSACTVYSFEQEISVQKIGFVTFNDFVGCSPDRFADDDGLAECKCLDDKGHFALILGGTFASDYIWQCQMQMLICKKKWADLFSYNPNYKEYLIVHRIVPDKTKILKLLAGFELGEKMIKDIEQKIGRV